MRHHRLLKRSEAGSAPVEATFAIVLLMVIVLGVVEVAFALYSRNVVAAAAHEGARAALEFGSTADEAARVARSTVETSAGGLVTDLEIDVARSATDRERRVVVQVTGRLKPFGPVPIAVPFRETAHAVASR